MKARRMVVGILALLIMAAFCAPAFAADVTIKGTVKDNQIVTDDGKAYNVAEGEKGDEVLKMDGKKVKATGAVVEKDGAMTITVTAVEPAE